MKRIRTIFVIFCVILISLPVGLSGTLIEKSSGTRSLPEQTWTQTTQMDFQNGALSNLTVTPTGEVKLDLETKYVDDDFIDLNKVAKKNNLIFDTVAKKVRLNTNSDIIINSTFGGTLPENGKSFKETSDGGYIIAGYGASYDTGGDVWLIKTDSSGVEKWNKTYNRNVYDGSNSVQLTSDGGYIIVGRTSTYSGGTQDIWLIKTDSSGIEQWNKTYDKEGMGDEGYSVHHTTDGGYIIVGITQSDVTNDNDIWLIKTDSLGNVQWNKTFGKGGYNDDEGKSVQQTTDGGYVIVGNTRSYGVGEIDVWLIKTDNSGNEQWNKTFGGSESDTGYSVQQTSDGGYIITGCDRSYGNGGEDVWLVKTDGSGNEQWNKTFGGFSDEIGKSVQQTSDGGYIISGWTQSYGAGSFDAWLIKTDSSGNEQWNRTVGGGEVEEFCYVQQTSSNDYVAVGGTTTFGAGDYDAWLIKVLDPANIPHSYGEFSSTNLINGQNAYLFDKFDYRSQIPLNTGIKIQFSQDNQNWYDSEGNLNNWDTLLNGEDQIDLSNLTWYGSYFYYRVNFTSKTTVTPLLFYINLSYNECLTSGILKSETFDSNTFPNWISLNWSSLNPSETTLKIQLRSANTEIDLNNENWTGPDGTSNSFYTISGQTIWSGHERDQWFQYKVYFSTTNTSKTPELQDVKITYEPIDTDNDNISDFTDLDDDNDGAPDVWEVQYGFDLLNYTDAPIDYDNDGLTNLQEYLNYTDPLNSDTDGDNLGDGFELTFSNTDPTNWDTNGNSIGDGLEFIQSQGYMGRMQSLPNDWIGMTITWDNYTIFIKTNSSVLEGEFDKTDKKLTIKVSGAKGTTGVTEIDVPKSLCKPENITVKFDGGLINYSLTQNSTHYNIHIEYNHSVHELLTHFNYIDKKPDDPIVDDPIDPIVDEPVNGTDEEKLSYFIYIIVLVIIIVVIIIIMIIVIKTRNNKVSNDVPDLPPQQLSKMLDEKHAKGEMTDETYNDIRSKLKKYQDQ